MQGAMMELLRMQITDKKKASAMSVIVFVMNAAESSKSVPETAEQP